MKLTKVKIFTISKNDGKISPERNILERLKPEVMNSFYDYVVIEVGSNEVRNYKGKEQKPADWDEYITGRQTVLLHQRNPRNPLVTSNLSF